MEQIKRTWNRYKSAMHTTVVCNYVLTNNPYTKCWCCPMWISISSIVRIHLKWIAGTLPTSKRFLRTKKNLHLTISIRHDDCIQPYVQESSESIINQSVSRTKPNRFFFAFKGISCSFSLHVHGPKQPYPFPLTQHVSIVIIQVFVLISHPIPLLLWIIPET